MGKGERVKLCTLIVKDDLSDYFWLRDTEESDSDTTAKILLGCFAAFGVMRAWISEQGSHLKNKFVTLLSEKLQANHKFTLPSCPWSNGSVEVYCRELLRSCRALF